VAFGGTAYNSAARASGSRGGYGNNTYGNGYNNGRGNDRGYGNGWHGGGGGYYNDWAYPYYGAYPYWGYGYPDYGYDYSSGPSEYSSATGNSISEQVQEDLAQQGYYQGPIDGVVGPGTRAAIAAYQRDSGLPVTGAIDGGLLRSLGLN
jgi:hypothetical protein